MALLTTTSTEGVSANEVILSGGTSISREAVTVISGQNLVAGTVLGKITASGKYTLHNNAASDGSEVASAVLLADCDASGGDTKGLILARLAEVKGDLLTYKAGISSPNKAAAIVALATSYIIVR
jgi:hypothetical protein